jgi:hypothetical protein
MSTSRQPTEQDRVHAVLRATIAAKQAAEFAEAQALAEAALDPGWTPWLRLTLIDRDQQACDDPGKMLKFWQGILGREEDSRRICHYQEVVGNAGLLRTRHKRQAETSESSGKSGLTGTQERPHPIAREPGRAGSERLGERVESRGAPSGQRSKVWAAREDVSGDGQRNQGGVSDLGALRTSARARMSRRPKCATHPSVQLGSGVRNRSIIAGPAQDQG